MKAVEATSERARRRLPGAVVAGGTALVSGVSVFVNGYGVHAVAQPAVYTTAKNLVAAVLLLVGAGVAVGWRRTRPTPVGGRDATMAGDARARPGPMTWAGIAYVGVVGGGVAFVLFFTGLAHSAAEPSAFLHDTLVVWVALLAVPVLRERISAWNVAAILLLVGGQVAVTGGVGHLVAGRGEALVLVATMLWAGETVVTKRVLRHVSPTTLACARMGIGVVVLTGYVAVSGHWAMLVGLDAHQVGWALLTGALLAVYVSTWMVALARARALDVTSVLVGSVVVTALLEAAAGHGGLGSEALGLALVCGGTAVVAVGWPRRAGGVHPAPAVPS